MVADVLLAGLKDAVIPAGNPVIVKFTDPANPFMEFILTLEVAALSPIGVDRVVEDDTSVKLGAGTVRLMVAEFVTPPTVPEILTE